MLLDDITNLTIGNAVNLTSGANTPGIRPGAIPNSQVLDRTGLVLSSGNVVTINTGLTGTSLGTPALTANSTGIVERSMAWSHRPATCLLSTWATAWPHLAQQLETAMVWASMQEGSSFYAPASCALSLSTGPGAFTDLLTASRAGVNATVSANTGCKSL